jgi:hypothetical protein
MNWVAQIQQETEPPQPRFRTSPTHIFGRVRPKVFCFNFATRLATGLGLQPTDVGKEYRY